MNHFTTDDRYFAKHYTKYGVIPTDEELPYKASDNSASGKYVHPDEDNNKGKSNKHMKQKQTKQTIKLNESQLRNIIKESIKKTLNESASGQMGNSIQSGNNAGNRITRNQNGQTVQNQNNMMQNRQQAQNQNQNVQNSPNTLNQILIPLKNLLSFENNLKEKYKTCSDNEIGMYQNMLNDISQIKQYLVSAGLFK